MEERKGLIRWIKEHKKELIIAGISIATLVLIVLGIKNRETLAALWDSLREVAKEPTAKIAGPVIKVATEIPQDSAQEVIVVMTSNSDTLPFEVSRHIRNLPEGWHASPEKIAEALKNNIILMEGQTWVDSYMKGGAAA